MSTSEEKKPVVYKVFTEPEEPELVDLWKRFLRKQVQITEYTKEVSIDARWESIWNNLKDQYLEEQLTKEFESKMSITNTDDRLKALKKLTNLKKNLTKKISIFQT